LHAQMPTGALDATGDVRWTPALGWNLRPRWPASIRATSRRTGRARCAAVCSTRGAPATMAAWTVAVDAPQSAAACAGGRCRARGAS
jgi:hypothetical protein